MSIVTLRGGNLQAAHILFRGGCVRSYERLHPYIENQVTHFSLEVMRDKPRRGFSSIKSLQDYQ